ncbi:acyltransferase family protein [Aquabacterium sp.]|uniref:acyltransferase family protein n=1 Tax=Aquabacterium sp. TaxID=1872578 RepID=UPI004037CB4F
MLNTHTSFQDRIHATGGKASGFDYMRLILALTVIVFHSVVTSYGEAYQATFITTPFGRLFTVVLPMFFSLSGFLVAGSLERAKGLTTFLGLRAFRIFPALIVDTFFCALIVGALLTTLPLREYVQHPEFLSYLGNALGLIHFHLPGVFQSNPTDMVNGQLWTVPLELECYIVIAGLALFGTHLRPRLFAALIVVFSLVLEARVLAGSAAPWTGRTLLLCFLAGITLYLNRSSIPWSRALFGLCAAFTVASLFDPRLAYLSPFPAAYATAYLGLANPPKIGLLQKGDYSYGLFLYGFPIQQVLVHVLPMAQHWAINILLAIPLTFIFAALSWHLIESPILARKTILKKIQSRVPRNPFATLLAGRRNA